MVAVVAVHALRQLFLLGPAASKLATLCALVTLRRAPAPEARMLLIRFAHHNEPLMTAGGDLLGLVDSETAARSPRSTPPNMRH